MIETPSGLATTASEVKGGLEKPSDCYCSLPSISVPKSPCNLTNWLVVGFPCHFFVPAFPFFLLLLFE